MNSNLQKVRSIFKSRTLGPIWHWSECVRKPIAAICLLGVLSSLMSLGVTLATKGMIDGATSADRSALWTWGAVLAGLILGQRAMSVLSAHLRINASATLQKRMQGMVTESILGKEYANLKGYHSGELVSRVFSDVAVVKGGILNLFPSLLRTAVSFIGAAVILITMDWRFIPVMIAAAVVGVLITMLFRDPMKRRHKRMQDAEARLQAGTQETLENVRLIKASVSEERTLGTLDTERAQLANEQVSNGRLSIWMQNGMGSMFDLSWLACNVWGCVKIFNGTFTYGSLAALIQLVGRIQSPIANAVSLMSEVYGVVASAERLLEIVGLPDEEEGTPLESFDEIRLENVFFQYQDGVGDVLTDVSCQIERGDFVGLTGISGGGKTSLFQLLLGIYKPTAGEVLIRQGEVSVRAAKGTRSLFAYVPQGNTLMSGTLRDNLTRFTDHVSGSELEDAIHAACLDHLVKEIGLDAVLGERGVGLSEGQAQRVAVARALLSGAPILLLDEATSALDEATEAEMLKNIGRMRDKTVLIVTHRSAALSICDYMLHIDNGRVTRTELAKEQN